VYRNQAGSPFVIYALVCPRTLEVRYVGQTIDFERRIAGGKSHSRQNKPLTLWLESLGHLEPYRVILEHGVNRQVTVKQFAADRAHVRGRKPTGTRVTWLSSCQEAKWIKRFRRTILNTNKTGEIGAYQALVNPPLPWGNGGDAPLEIPPRNYRKKPTAKVRHIVQRAEREDAA
jgi:hypothetical protein